MKIRNEDENRFDNFNINQLDDFHILAKGIYDRTFKNLSFEKLFML